MQFHFVEGGVNVGDEGSEVVLVVRKGPQDHIVLADPDGLGSLQDAVCSLGRGEDDGTFPALHSDLFPQLALLQEIALHWGWGTLRATSSSSVSSGGLATLMKSFLSVS